MNAIEIISRQLPATPNEIKSFKENAINAINESIANGISPAKAFSILKALSEMFSEIAESIESDVRNEIELSNEKSVKTDFGKYEIGQRRTFDYSNEPRYTELKERQKAELKSLEMFCKTGADADGCTLEKPIEKITTFIKKGGAK